MRGEDSRGLWQGEDQPAEAAERWT